MHTGYIYRITNKKNNKKYIGMTTQKPKKRFNQHKNLAKNGSEMTIHRAFRKYGVNEFEFEIVSKLKHEKKEILFNELKKEEKKQIRINDTFENGYNSTRGGDGILGYEHTEETKKKLAITSTGRIHTEQSKKLMSRNRSGIPVNEDTRKKMSDNAKKRIGEKNHFYNKNHTQETKEKISKTRKKEIYMYDLNGDFIKKYNDVLECCYENNFPISKYCKTNPSITKVANKEKGTYKNMQFRYYKKNNIGIFNRLEGVKKSNGKKIIRNDGVVYKTKTELCEELGTYHRMIDKIIKERIVLEGYTYKFF